MPTAQPTSSAPARIRAVKSPSMIAGKVCKIQTPPSSCRSIAYWVGRNRMKTSAPDLTTSDTSLAVCASAAGAIAGSTKVRQTLRVNRLAAPIDMIAAGTRAPIAIAAKLKPTNQSGKILMNRAGTTSVGEGTETPAAIAM